MPHPRKIRARDRRHGMFGMLLRRIAQAKQKFVTRLWLTVPNARMQAIFTLIYMEVVNQNRIKLMAGIE
jgi:hypothetical protein